MTEPSCPQAGSEVLGYLGMNSIAAWDVPLVLLVLVFARSARLNPLARSWCYHPSALPIGYAKISKGDGSDTDCRISGTLYTYRHTHMCRV